MSESSTDRESLDYWPYRTFNWRRWPDQRGALNLIDAAATARGVAAVETHQVFCLGAAR